MSLASGDKLGPYEIVEPIGAGGMGEVYRARDTRLGREVAIKVSDQKFGERFEREARVISSLNHPNICTLYDVGDNYLVMELVEGVTLSDRIKEGPIPLNESLGIARKIADALEAAHEKGIVHRDLKPGNVIVKEDGSVKVLDFGLAKAGPRTASASPDDPELSPTISMAATQAGVILGTAAYMAPEQARGRPVDKRADIWAFGVVLYEMVTGKRLFQGEDLTDTLASVVKIDPDLSAAPPELRPLLEKCLQKDPRKRLRDIGGVELLLEVGRAHAAVRADARPAKLPLIPWAVAALAVVAAGVALWGPWRAPAPAPEVFRYRLAMPPNTTYSPTQPQVAPNGRKLLFVAGGADGVPRVWVQDLNSLEEAHPLPGTEGNTLPAFWSFDSRWVVFQSDGKLMKVETSGRAPVTLCDLNGQTALFGSENAAGQILFGTGAGIWQVPSAGGAATPVTALDRAGGETRHNQPRFLPDGRHFLYFRGTLDADRNGVYIGDLNFAPEQQSMQPLMLNRTGAWYSAPRGAHPGFLLFLRDGNLFAQRFDEQSLHLQGDPVRVADQVDTYLDGAEFSVSDNGVLVYRSGSPVPYQLAWFDRQGNRVGTAGLASTLLLAPAISPAGTQAIFSRVNVNDGRYNLWRIDLERNQETQLTAIGSSASLHAVWSPDGKQIVFAANRGSGSDLYRTGAGGGEEELLLQSPDDKFPFGWSRDGRFLLYTARAPETGSDIWVLALDDPPRQVRLLDTPAEELNPQFSPNMRWLAYSSDESGGVEQIIVRELLPGQGEDLFRAGPPQPISRKGGTMPEWRGDGRELFYQTPGGTIMAVTMGGGDRRAGSLDPGEPAALFRQSALISGFDTWTVASDGQRFLSLATPEQSLPPPLTVVVNWQEGLEQ